MKKLKQQISKEEQEKYEDDEDYEGRVLSDFRHGKLIGKGSYAMVKIARDRKTRKKMALKYYDKKNLQTIKR